MVEVLLEPLSWDNIDDVLAESDSNSEFFKLPTNEDEAEEYMCTVNNQLPHDRSYWFSAYAQDREGALAGGGQIYVQNEVTVSLGWWVAIARRRQGYGKAIVAALEEEAIVRVSSIERFEALIKHQNLGSCALAASMGYSRTEIVDENGLITFRKSLEYTRSPQP